MSFEGKCQLEIGKWTEYCLKKENGRRTSSAPALELNTIIFKHVYWYMQQISGERLQDHWSSGFAMKFSIFISEKILCMANFSKSLCQIDIVWCKLLPNQSGIQSRHSILSGVL